MTLNSNDTNKESSKNIQNYGIKWKILLKNRWWTRWIWKSEGKCEMINQGECEYFTKIKFDSDDYLPSCKLLKLHNLTIAVRFVFQEEKKY